MFPQYLFTYYRCFLRFPISHSSLLWCTNSVTFGSSYHQPTTVTIPSTTGRSVERTRPSRQRNVGLYDLLEVWNTPWITFQVVALRTLQFSSRHVSIPANYYLCLRGGNSDSYYVVSGGCRHPDPWSLPNRRWCGGVGVVEVKRG